ncbi:hypothetical protein BP00DRAFT_427861 [Aspergillus indologenus CBS 114.80]|uniref:Secreted protein n=1 Tax=Aspergillus indologenus CBS 114.80 TaxID=1450541 RepID=A0A2V5IXY0_9EURO|nr:hypothetical protein BP00DRAFT_427861 [Aspergillus indologenus CBS 114.80]
MSLSCLLPFLTHWPLAAPCAPYMGLASVEVASSTTDLYKAIREYYKFVVIHSVRFCSRLTSQHSGTILQEQICAF